MAICAGCKKEFVDTPLFPRLVVSDTEEKARNEAKEKGLDVFCLSCWLKEAKKIEKDDLAMVILGLLKRVEEAEKKQPPTITVYPYTYPIYYYPVVIPSKPYWNDNPRTVEITCGSTQNSVSYSCGPTLGGTIRIE